MTDRPPPSDPSSFNPQGYERKILMVAAIFIFAALAGGLYMIRILVPPPVPEIVDAPVEDTLMPAHPVYDYDNPLLPPEPYGRLSSAQGQVTKIASRRDRMSDGSRRWNFYARTEFPVKERNGMICYFHQYMGIAPFLRPGDTVTVQYNPDARDYCGTAHIVKDPHKKEEKEENGATDGD
ncbi:MAG: hypothetical protein EA357_07565 [Micavibrio sp.]|nr:MAG: hypothetical protein EA357_07565 [Micavibrio sp.]